MIKQEVIQNQIDDIMDEFDFDQVEKVMEFLGWEWSSSNGVPEKYEIKKQARKLLKQAAEFNGGGTTSTGGFVASSKFGEDGNGKWVLLKLDFSIESSLLDGEYYDN